MLPMGMPDDFYDWYIKNYIREEMEEARRKRRWKMFCEGIKWFFAILFLVVIFTLPLFLLGGVMK